jgi:hypothetical protein
MTPSVPQLIRNSPPSVKLVYSLLVHRSLSLGRTSAHPFTHHFSNIHFNTILPFLKPCLSIPNCLLLSGCPIKILYAFLIFPCVLHVPLYPPIIFVLSNPNTYFLSILGMTPKTRNLAIPDIKINGYVYKIIEQNPIRAMYCNCGNAIQRK